MFLFQHYYRSHCPRLKFLRVLVTPVKQEYVSHVAVVLFEFRESNEKQSLPFFVESILFYIAKQNRILAKNIVGFFDTQLKF